MAWRNYKDNTVIWFKSKGKEVLSNGSNGAVVTWNKNVTGSSFSFSNTKAYVGQRIAIKAYNITQPITFDLLSSPDFVSNQISARYTLTPDKPEVHAILLSSCFMNDTSTETLRLGVNISGLGEETNDYVTFEILPYAISTPAESFVDKQTGTVSSLNQLLSVIKGELWYNVSYGLPLYDKISTKYQMDSNIINIINNHNEVKAIKSFNSSISGHSYNCEVVVDSIYGELKIVV